MSMNRFMHPRNIYKNKPDFLKLAEGDANFKKFLKPGLSGKSTIDFKDKDAVRALSKALLSRDFDLQVEIPPDTLIPALPLRLNYLLWIEDLLHWTADKEEVIHGIDIGTGASCIYSLLAAKKNKWKMTATEIRKESVEVAVKNIKANKLEDCISVVKVDEEQFLVGVLEVEKTYDFCMCNPPFFACESETDSMSKSRSPHREPPKNAFSGSPSELVAVGGELKFIREIINDSKYLATRVKVYTSMVGHKNNADILVKELRLANAKSVSRTEFCQGNTTRWGIAWTFCEKIKLPEPVNQVVHNKKLQQPMELFIPEDIETMEYTVFNVTNTILEIFQCLQFTVKENGKPLYENSKKASYDVSARQNTWSNQRRKRREQKFSDNANAEPACKKLKLEIVEPEPSTSSLEMLQFKFLVGIADKKIFIKLTWCDGCLGRDSLHQILQYIKNALHIK
ncbi:U6 small nuclear RNA (adenine-(43)-N(6))-methyltransferase isoform X2 [Neocloeon triangulifer]|nr:U6 small nuclear RNA (adenine-(43)-N(6))-methyltransferase isoform X2 [Neocloeon triangulifer]